jgi:hypothetical protein
VEQVQGELKEMAEERLPWRPEFIEALRLLANLSDAMDARGLPRPVLVGGGAAEFYSGSAMMTGDLDVTSPVQGELEEELRHAGFVRPSGAGQSLRGWIHPDIGLGFEVVGSSPMGGGIEPARLRFVTPPGAKGRFRIVCVEDLIADRMGQFASGSAPEMLGQARTLLKLYPNVDRAYLEQRVRKETVGDYGAEDIAG